MVPRFKLQFHVMFFSQRAYLLVSLLLLTTWGLAVPCLHPGPSATLLDYIYRHDTANKPFPISAQLSAARMCFKHTKTRFLVMDQEQTVAPETMIEERAERGK